jgi:hypothetical protein
LRFLLQASSWSKGRGSLPSDEAVGVTNEWYQFTATYFTNKSTFIKHEVIPFAAVTNGTMNTKYEAYKMKHSFWNMIFLNTDLIKREVRRTDNAGGVGVVISTEYNMMYSVTKQWQM